MSRSPLIQEIGEWLIDQALAEPDIVEMFNQVCARLYAIGVPIGRARLTWPTLHPLFQAETVLWRRGEETEFEQFRHQEEHSDEWSTSPMAYMYDHDVEQIRRNLDGPNKLVDFPILDDLIEAGLTDYLAIATGFSGQRSMQSGKSGIIVSWACDRVGGFSDEDIAALNRIQRRFASAVKNAVQQRIASNITETYLGRHAGQEVLNGAIKLGDGRETKAVVWYSDMRRSTELADTMPPEDFLELLNDYFECTAGPAIELGGEVLDFIGDAVLAIFPFEDDEGKKQAISCATMAIENAIKQSEVINKRRENDGKIGFEFGVGVNVGPLMFGNIGVATRLSFSVIGPTINEVERIETMTKAIDAVALASKEVAAAAPELWTSIGKHPLKGVAAQSELFALNIRESDHESVTGKSLMKDADAETALLN